VASKLKVLVHRQHTYSQLVLKPHSSLRHRKIRKKSPYFARIKRKKTCHWWNKGSLGLKPRRSHPDSTHNHSLLLEIWKPAKNPKTTEKKSILLPDTKNSNASPHHENLRILAVSHQELKRHFTFETCRATFWGGKPIVDGLTILVTSTHTYHFQGGHDHQPPLSLKLNRKPTTQGKGMNVHKIIFLTTKGSRVKLHTWSLSLPTVTI
jgi:hypothetical protein